MDNKLEYSPNSSSIEKIYFKDVSVWADAGNIRIEGIDDFTLTEIFNATGKRVYYATLYDNRSIPLQKGIYLIRLTNRQGNIKVVKCSLE